MRSLGLAFLAVLYVTLRFLGIFDYFGICWGMARIVARPLVRAGWLGDA